MKNSSFRQSFLVLMGLCLWIGCSEDQKIDAVQVDGSEGTIDAKLVGKWVGEMEGNLGTEAITMTLLQNGSISTTSATDLYCALSGTWEVVGKNFEAKGEDNCDGTIVDLTAPTSSTELEGSWSKANGEKGNFSVTKE